MSKTINKWKEKHPGVICEIDRGDGYNTDSGMAYNILLNRGWCWREDGMHTIIEETVREIMECLSDVSPCGCDDCKTGNGW